MKVVAKDNAKPIKMWTDHVPVEPEAMKQLHNISELPFIYKHIAVMPDVHFGKGATVGSVIPTKGAIIPAAVGVDIGCGMCAIRTTMTSQQLPDSLSKVRAAIEAVIPVGNADFSNEQQFTLPDDTEILWRKHFMPTYNELQEKYPAIATKRSAGYQIGTLGGGNHFVELCIDQDDRVWVMLHSGSRGVGNRIGTFFIGAARREMERHFINLPDRDLAYLAEGSTLFDDYMRAVHWAQDYAKMNRKMMMAATLRVLDQELTGFQVTDQAINCHHNYIAKESHFGENVWVTRKGAVRARKDDLGIIPGSMGTRSYIVRGCGHEQAFCSCSHGAGRAMSRTKAKEHFTLDDHILATAGVECRKDLGVLDETPGAYKKIEDVMRSQEDLVDIVHELKQVLCVKG